jgi:hypothetical protein
MLIGLVNNRTNKRKSLKNPYDKNKQKKRLYLLLLHLASSYCLLPCLFGAHTKAAGHTASTEYSISSGAADPEALSFAGK